MSISYKASHIEDISKTNESLGKDKISKPIMTIYEFDKIIGMRTQQLSSGAIPFISNIKKVSSNMELRQVALEELKQGKLPFIIERILPNKKKEHYRVRDLDLVAIRDRIR
jgi:DNA-directed RNA polymerase subunit K/omega